MADPRPSLDDLVRLVATAGDNPTRQKAFARLLKAATGPAAVAAVRGLAGAGPGGPRLALELAARLLEPVSPEVVPAVMPLLHDEQPVPLKLSAAGKLLSALPDDERSVGRIIQPLVAGLSPYRELERLTHLQNRVAKCDTLDRLVAAAESKLSLKCPHCPAKLPRPKLIPHLWTRHRQLFAHGKAADPRGEVDATITAAATSPDPAALDHAFLLANHYYPDASPRMVFQALAARGNPDPTQTDRLLVRAAEDRAGVCPVCLSAVPDPLPELPPPADVSPGRVAADGFIACVEDKPLGRITTLDAPTGPLPPPPLDTRLPPRLAAVAWALAAFVIVMGAVVGLAKVVHPVLVAGVGLLLGWGVYWLVLSRRQPLPDRTDAAMALVWDEFVPGIGRSPAAVRYLTRVCRAGLTAGEPADRTKSVFELVEHAAVLADKGGEYAQLLAVARVLQAWDGAKLGRELVAGLVPVFEPFFRGEVPPAYAEAAAETLLDAGTLSDGDLRRIGVRVIAAAFNAGLSPADLTTVTRFCPGLRQLIGGAKPGDLGLLAAVWNGRVARPWGGLGEAATVFEVAQDTPAAGRRLLAAHPDLLFRLQLGEAAESALGPVVVTGRGVMVAGVTVADPDARVELVQTANGVRLAFGTHLIEPAGKLPARVADQLRGWLRYRTDNLLPLADQLAGRRSPERVAALLAPLAVDCHLCGTRCVHRAGRLGTMWQAVAGG
jgi:hypothetical protein